MKLGVPKETYPGERRVAIVPAVIPTLKKLGVDVVVERGAGEAAGFLDAAYADQQATVADRAAVFQADLVAQVRALGANPANGTADLELMRRGLTIVGFAEPRGDGLPASELCGSQPPLAGDELVTPLDAPHEQRLEHVVGLEALG